MDDSQAIRGVALDYIEGWYEADADRMDRALSRYLAKRRVVSKDEVWHVDKAWMVDATRAERGRIDDPTRGRKEIHVLDRTDTMASVKIVSERFVDYLHLAKVDGRWSIVNVLWELNP